MDTHTLAESASLRPRPTHRTQTPWNVPWKSMELHGVPWGSIEFYSMEFRGIQWNSTGFHGTPWKPTHSSVHTHIFSCPTSAPTNHTRHRQRFTAVHLQSKKCTTFFLTHLCARPDTQTRRNTPNVNVIPFLGPPLRPDTRTRQDIPNVSVIPFLDPPLLLLPLCLGRLLGVSPGLPSLRLDLPLHLKASAEARVSRGCLRDKRIDPKSR